MAFLRKEYSILAWFIVVVAVLLSLGIGAAHRAGLHQRARSARCWPGFVGMKAATKANVRTAAGRDGASGATRRWPSPSSAAP